MFFHRSNGIIALDIDGTVTAEAHAIEQNVIDKLSDLVRDGWKLIFITGRPFQWGFRSLEPVPFSYILAVQNGALLLEMPSKKILNRNYLSYDILPGLESICQELKTDFVIYSGFENGERCYYRPNYLPPEILSYVLQRTAYLGEKWESFENYSQLPISRFASIKFFSKEGQANILSQMIESKLGLHAPSIRDPYNPNYFVIQATHSLATKGLALKEFIRQSGISGPIIAAGDDHNDKSMLEIADIKIVMANAPAELLELADIIAPQATEQGIIVGLEEAIHRLRVT